MAHYAFLDLNNVVTEVIVGKDEDQLLDGLTTEEWYGRERNQRCLRTSYNGKIRKNFAGVGYRYDELRDAFISPQPFLSWSFDEETCNWTPPIPYPDDGQFYYWDETTKEWKLANANT